MTPRQRKRGSDAAVRRRSEAPTQSAVETAPHAMAPGEQFSVTQEFKAYMGPIPDPDAFRSYEKTLPGAADRLLGTFELQVSHRVKQEDRWLRLHFRKDLVGQCFSLITILAVLGLGGYLATTGTLSLGILFSVIGLFNFSILMLRKARLFGQTPTSTAPARSELPERPAQKNDDSTERQRAV